jgi:sugar phosphate isomerase/epimerase
MTGVQPDHGKLIGMSLMAGRDDIEVAGAMVKELGFEGMEVHGNQIGPSLPGVPVFEAHAAAVGDVVRRAGLIVSSLNVVGDSSFDPFGGPTALATTVEGLAAHMRWAAAMGAPRVLIWEGRVAKREDLDAACKTLANVIDNARRRSGLSDPPSVSCELHPFTFALKYRALPELATALRSVGAGICFDFCHFGVALGGDLFALLAEDVVDTIDHIHFSDTDGRTSELHFPPGEGMLDLAAIGERIAGKPIAASWDLFGWPGPRYAVSAHMDAYRGFVEKLALSVRIKCTSRTTCP